MGVESVVARRSDQVGFTLVELMIVVAIIGVLAALAIYGVRRYVLTAKIAEAKAGGGRLAKDASGSFNAERMEGVTMNLGSSAGGTNRFCGGLAAVSAGAGTIPTDMGSVAARKWQSAPSDWSASAAFQCLGFSMVDPQYFAYGYQTTNCAGSGGVCSNVGASFRALAFGDLDGDGAAYSTFAFAGGIQADPAVGGGVVVTLAPSYEATDELE